MSGGLMPPRSGGLISGYDVPSAGGVTEEEFEELEGRVETNEEEVETLQEHGNAQRYLSLEPPPGYASEFEVLYQFDGTADNLKDRTPNGRDLSLVATPFVGTAFGEAGLKAWRTGWDSVWGRSAQDAALASLGAMTIEAQFALREQDSNSANSDVVCGLAELGTAESQNVTASIRVHGGSAYFETNFEYSNPGVNELVEWLDWRCPPGRVIYVAVVRQADGVTYNMYIDGYDMGQRVASTPPTGGSLNRFWVGGWTSATSFRADIYSCRYSKGAMTALHIAQVNEALRAL